jgi:hypothetical protein
MENSRVWILTLGILIIFALAGLGLVWVVNDTLNRTLKPVQDVTGNVGTRVAQVLNPSPTILPDPITVIRDVRALARLETIQFTVEKVITAENGQGPFGFLFGDRLILVAHGNVIAGIDLEKLGPDDLWTKDGVLYVGLPDPEVFISALDNNKSYVYTRETGLLTKGNISLESAARLAAEQEIMKAALGDGILEMARNNAELFLYRLLRDLGYPEVIFLREQAAQTTVTPTP